MQDPTDNRDVAIAVAPDPLDQLVKRVRVGEDVAGGLPNRRARWHCQSAPL